MTEPHNHDKATGCEWHCPNRLSKLTKAPPDKCSKCDRWNCPNPFHATH